MFPAHTKQMEKGTTSESRDMRSILSNRCGVSQSLAPKLVHIPVRRSLIHNEAAADGTDAESTRFLINRVERST